MAQSKMEKVMELSSALQDRETNERMFRFMENNGITPAAAGEHGGWIPILIGMVPDQYPTVNDLVQAIKKS